MAVYLIIEIAVKNREMYLQYVERVPAIIEKHGGRYLARGGEITPLMGDWNPERIILIEFGSADQIKKCFASPEYHEIAPLREESTISKSIIVEGLEGIKSQ
jgi:uncharacterized protein (DUF1330 family)